MKTMCKKVSIFLSAMLLVLSLSACGNAGRWGSLQNTQQVSSQSKIQDTDTSGTSSAEGIEIMETESTLEIESTEVTETSESTETEIPHEDGKTLIVYFSWSTDGNTEKMAEYIQQQTGAEILRLEPANPYPTEYSETGDLAKVERDENARPEIANLPESISEYDTIFLGYPIWWHTAPMIIGTFLESYDLTGVEIYPFTQSASMDVEQFNNSMDFVRENAPEADVHGGLFAEASDTEKIMEYLTDNGLVE